MFNSVVVGIKTIFFAAAIMTSVFLARSSFAAGKDEKPHWMAGCMSQKEETFREAYKNDASFRVLQDYEYGKGGFLKTGIVVSAHDACKGLKKGMIKISSVKVWKSVPDTETEGCWYENWMEMEHASDEDGHLKDENLRTPFYIQYCKTAPDEKWRQKWNKIRSDFLVK